MMNLKKYFILLVSLVMFSCSPTVVPPSSTIPTPPTQTESVKPSLEKVKEGVNNSIVQNAKVEEKIATQKSTIETQKAIIETALTEAKKLEAKLKTKETITEAEIASLSTKIDQIKKENQKLIEVNTSLAENVKYLSTILDLTRQESVATSNSLDQAEKELITLRDQNKTISSDLKARNSDVEKMQKQVLSSEKTAASAKVYRNWIWGIAGVFAFWTILKNVLMFYFPNIKFRV